MNSRCNGHLPPNSAGTDSSESACSPSTRSGSWDLSWPGKERKRRAGSKLEKPSHAAAPQRSSTQEQLKVICRVRPLYAEEFDEVPTPAVTATGANLVRYVIPHEPGWVQVTHNVRCTALAIQGVEPRRRLVLSTRTTRWKGRDVWARKSHHHPYTPK